MDLHEFMRRGIQCGMRYSNVGTMCTREESWVCWDEVPVVAVGGVVCAREWVGSRMGFGVLEWRESDVPGSSVGWYIAVE